MSSKRISIRFNMDDEEERKAWELLHSSGVTLISKEIIKRINDAEKYKNLEEIIRKAVAEELRSLPLMFSLEQEQSTKQDEESEKDIFDFLDSF